MLTSDDLTTPDWTLVIKIGNSELRTTIHDADRLLPGGIVPEGAGVWVQGTTDKDCNLYLVQIGDGAVAVLYPGDGSADLVDKGVSVRLPAGNNSYLTPISGRIRAVESPEPVPADDWWKLLHGRDPKQQGTTILNSVMLAGSTPSPTKGGGTSSSDDKKKKPTTVSQ